MIKDIEQKFKLTFLVSLTILIISIGGICFTVIKTYSFLEEQRKNIYVLDNGIPLLISQSGVEENRTVERQAHVNTFHRLFFTLPPDNDFIEKNIKKATYLADESAMFEFKSLKEKNFFSNLLSTSTNVTILTDSIVLTDQGENIIFDYYGTQRLDRRSSTLIRGLHTRGNLRDIQRSENNPHGIIIENWRTVSNNDIKLIKKG